MRTKYRSFFFFSPWIIYFYRTHFGHVKQPCTSIYTDLKNFFVTEKTFTVEGETCTFVGSLLALRKEGKTPARHSKITSSSRSDILRCKLMSSIYTHAHKHTHIAYVVSFNPLAVYNEYIRHEEMIILFMLWRIYS